VKEEKDKDKWPAPYFFDKGRAMPQCPYLAPFVPCGCASLINCIQYSKSTHGSMHATIIETTAITMTKK
jgi:hypothetical protein